MPLITHNNLQLAALLCTCKITHLKNEGLDVINWGRTVYTRVTLIYFLQAVSLLRQKKTALDAVTAAVVSLEVSIYLIYFFAAQDKWILMHFY